MGNVCEIADYNTVMSKQHSKHAITFCVTWLDTIVYYA
jgi:hypothetical protein